MVFWDLFGEQGHRVRATISEMGPLLLSRLLDLNDTQEGVLNIAFRIADEQGLLLLDLKDLRALLQLIAENARQLTTTYGNVSKATIGTIQRQLLVLENQKGEEFLGEPALDIKDLMRTDRDGRGVVNILAADKLMNNPRLYATFLLWLMSELFEELPEVGDLDQPKLVFFFDEAHLLFNDAPKALLETVERVVRLIRSKGVGVYFITQNPVDVPESRAGAARQPGPACASRLYAARAEGGARGGADLPAEPGLRHREGHHRTRRRRGAGLDPRGQGRALDGGAHADRAADGAGRTHRTAAAPADHRGEPAAGQVRSADRSANPPTRCWPSAPRRRPPRRRRRRAAAASSTCSAACSAPRGQRKGSMTVTQRVTREVTRTIVNQTVGNLAAEIGKSIGGRQGSSIGRAIVRGTLGGLLRR